MRKGDVVLSRRHKGLIRLVVVYSNGGGHREKGQAGRHAVPVGSVLRTGRHHGR
jgi:hypothetical protein